jgi:hypothetical protein
MNKLRNKHIFIHLATLQHFNHKNNTLKYQYNGNQSLINRFNSQNTAYMTWTVENVQHNHAISRIVVHCPTITNFIVNKFSKVGITKVKAGLDQTTSSTIINGGGV